MTQRHLNGNGQWTEGPLKHQPFKGLKLSGASNMSSDKPNPPADPPAAPAEPTWDQAPGAADRDALILRSRQRAQQPARVAAAPVVTTEAQQVVERDTVRSAAEQQAIEQAATIQAETDIDTLLGELPNPPQAVAVPPRPSSSKRPATSAPPPPPIRASVPPPSHAGFVVADLGTTSPKTPRSIAPAATTAVLGSPARGAPTPSPEQQKRDAQEEITRTQNELDIKRDQLNSVKDRLHVCSIDVSRLETELTQKEARRGDLFEALDASHEAYLELLQGIPKKQRAMIDGINQEIAMLHRETDAKRTYAAKVNEDKTKELEKLAEESRRLDDQLAQAKLANDGKAIEINATQQVTVIKKAHRSNVRRWAAISALVGAFITLIFFALFWGSGKSANTKIATEGASVATVTVDNSALVPKPAGKVVSGAPKALNFTIPSNKSVAFDPVDRCFSWTMGNNEYCCPNAPEPGPSADTNRLTNCTLKQ